MRIVGSKKRENAESLAEAHTVHLYHERETKYHRLDIKGTGKDWKFFSPHFLCKINHQWLHENQWCSQKQLTCTKPLISVAGLDTLSAQRLLQNRRKETCRIFSAPSYGHLGFIFSMCSLDERNLVHSEMKHCWKNKWTNKANEKSSFIS